MGCIEDSKIKILVPKSLLKKIKQSIDASSLENAPESIKQIFDSPLKDTNVLLLVDLVWLHGHKTSDQCLHEWIGLSKIEIPTVKPIPRNPELEARIQKLKAQQADREYQKMTKNVDSSRFKLVDESIGSQIKQINQQLIAVLQFIFSVAAGFLFGFMGIDLLVGEQDVGFRLLLGVICALIIALAEIYFLAKQLADVVTPSLSQPSKPSQKSHSD